MLNSSMYQSPAPYRNGSIAQSSLGDRAVSPSRAKIAQLTEKLSNLQNQIEEDKSLKKEVYETKLKALDDKFTKGQQADGSRLKQMQEQLIKIEESLVNEKVFRETNDEQFRQRDLKNLEQQLQKELQKDRVLRKEAETKLARFTDEKTYQFRLEVSRQKKTREETEEQFGNEIGERVLHLNDEVQGERREREEACQDMISRFGDSVHQLQETLTREKRLREDAHGQMYRMLDEMNQILNMQMIEEKVCRETTEETMLRLLDETCNRVEGSLRR